MAEQLEKLSQFSESGKTFFFNKGRAKNDADFLSISALYGQGQQQRLVLFPAQFISFYKHLTKALETVGGITFGSPAVEAPRATLALECPPNCPKCRKDYRLFRISPIFKGEDHEGWYVWCENCGETVL